MPNGYLGVDIFFFITGFCLYPQIKIITESNKGAFLQHVYKFIGKRFRRLMPAFSISTIISLILLTLFASLRELNSIYIQSLLSLFFLGNVGAKELIGDYFQPNPNPFLHYWSLSSEWQLYIFAPLLFFFARRYLKLSISVIISSLLLVGVVCNTLFGDFFLLNYYSPLSRMWEFALGMYVYEYKQRTQERQMPGNLFAILTLLCLVPILGPFKLDLAVGQLISGVFFISYIESNLKLNEVVKKGLLWLGDRSYSVYLYHMPLIYLALHSPSSGEQSFRRIIGVLIAMIALIFVAHLSYFYVEQFESRKDSLLHIKVKGVLFGNISYAVSVFGVVLLLIANSLFLSHLHSSKKVLTAWEKYPKCVQATAPCYIAGKLTDNRILLFGDSHSIQYFGVMSNLTKSQKISVHYLRGDITNSENPAQAFKQIIQFKPDVVIISQYNRNLTNISHLRRNLEFLKSQGIAILYISENPVFRDFVAYTHYINPSLISGYVEREPNMRVPVIDLNSDALEVARNILSIIQSSKIAYVNPFEHLCNDGFCKRKIADDFVYFDDNHLSIFGASILEEPISRNVSKLLKFASDSRKEISQ